MAVTLAQLIFCAGIVQLGVLLASVQVPFRLKWGEEVSKLPRLTRNLFWVYGGYTLLAIVALGLISVFNAEEMASGTGLARWVCGYIALFWGARLALVSVLDVREHLTSAWLKVGYGILLVGFVGLAGIFGWAAVVQV
jgi:hypothetical protein